MSSSSNVKPFKENIKIIAKDQLMSFGSQLVIEKTFSTMFITPANKLLKWEFETC